MSKSQEGLIEFCTDVNEAIEIVEIYKSGKEELAVELLKDHLSKCDACFKMYGVVNDIQQVFDYDVDKERFKEFIQVVDRVSVSKSREEYSITHIYSCFTSKKVRNETIYSQNKWAVEELTLADDFYKHLMDSSEEESKQNTRKMAFANPFSFVAAAAVIAMISFQFIYTNNNQTGNSISRSNLFPKFDKEFAYTPINNRNAGEDASQNLLSSFGLPIDKDLEEVYSLNYSDNTESPSFFNVSMIE